MPTQSWTTIIGMLVGLLASYLAKKGLPPLDADGQTALTAALTSAFAYGGHALAGWYHNRSKPVPIPAAAQPASSPPPPEKP